MIQQQPGDTPVLGGALISSQVVEKLLEEMRTGCYAQGARLPAEIELAAHLQVSRTVVRDALSEMEREGCGTGAGHRHRHQPPGPGTEGPDGPKI